MEDIEETLQRLIEVNHTLAALIDQPGVSIQRLSWQAEQVQRTKRELQHAMTGWHDKQSVLRQGRHAQVRLAFRVELTISSMCLAYVDRLQRSYVP